MRYLALVILILLILSSTALAGLDFGTVQGYVEDYNNNITKAPTLMTEILGNEKVDLVISLNDSSSFRVGFDVQKAYIAQTIPGGIDNPSITITTSESFIEKLKSSENPVATLDAERKKNEGSQIKIISNNPITSWKLGFVLASTPVLEFFYNIFFGG
jgi:hypothetical protein